MKITFAKLNAMLAALNDLNGRMRVMESEGRAVNAALENFIFPTQTKVNIIRNRQNLQPHSEAYAEARKKIIEDISPDGTGASIDRDPALGKLYQERLYELNKSKVEVRGLLILEWAVLDTAKVNPITIADLGVIEKGGLVKGLPKADDKDLVPEIPEILETQVVEPTAAPPA